MLDGMLESAMSQGYNYAYNAWDARVKRQLYESDLRL